MYLAIVHMRVDTCWQYDVQFDKIIVLSYLESRSTLYFRAKKSR
ncbi:MAG: hypothetical protein K0Q63_407 [Paenibacillus sp.]|nr:hypothetical protein [Paenibacillus sp.]